MKELLKEYFEEYVPRLQAGTARVLSPIFSLVFPSRSYEQIVSTLSAADLSRLPPPETNLGSLSPDIHALFSYKDPRVRALVWEMKYHRSPRALSLLGTALADFIMDELSDEVLFIHSTESSIVLVPVPLSAGRLRERKFSQTDLLARAVLSRIPKDVAERLAYRPEALKKIRETTKQSWTKNKSARLKNLADCFAADANLIHGRVVLLVDDVVTSGATLDEASRALKRAGARKIISFTIAH